MTEPTAFEVLERISELRVEVAKINERLENIPHWREETAKAADRADNAEDTANEALALAQAVQKDVQDYRAERKADVRWFIGIALSVFALLVPIFLRFYFGQ